jgi:hypothetical protein
MCIAVVHGILDNGCGDAPAGAIIDVLASRMAADLWSPHERPASFVLTVAR